MACFVAPVAEAVIVTAAVLIIKKKEKERTVKLSLSDGSTENASKMPFSKKLGWLCKLLWGGSFLLAFEHLWHGEVVPWFPFLTAMSNPEDTAEMLSEIGTVGVSMALLITAVWGVMMFVAHLIEKRAPVTAETAEGGAAK